MTFEELKKQSKIDVRIDKANLVDASANSPLLHHKYLLELYNAKDQLIKLKHIHNELTRDKWLYYSGKASTEIYEKNPFPLKVLKTDLHLFLDSDEEMQASTYKIEYVKNKIDFIKDVISELNRRSFNISNINKTNRFENGEF